LLRESVLLAEDETDLLLFPPLRANWGRRGQPTRVLISGRNARRVVFGAMNLRTGKRLFLAREHQRQNDFRAFLELIHRHYRGRHIALLLDENPSHTAGRSQQLATELHIKLLWLPKRAPELNPMDQLWGQAKDIVSANLQYPTIDEQLNTFIEYLECLTDWEARYTSGVLSDEFWLKSVV
jgi:transposase